MCTLLDKLRDSLSLTGPSQQSSLARPDAIKLQRVSFREKIFFWRGRCYKDSAMLKVETESIQMQANLFITQSMMCASNKAPKVKSHFKNNIQSFKKESTKSSA